MNYEEIINKEVENRVENAKQLFKKKFMNFSKDIFDTNEDVWQHLWDIPVIEDKKLRNLCMFIPGRIIDDVASAEIGEADAVAIPSLTDSINEYIKDDDRYNDVDIPFLDCDAVMIYNFSKMKNLYIETVSDYKDYYKSRAQTVDINELNEKIGKGFEKRVAKTLLHEMCHLNSNSLIQDEYVLEKTNMASGARMLETEKTMLTGDIDAHGKIEKKYAEYDEVGIDTLALLMMYHEPKESIEDTLERIIEKRNGNSRYEYLDDRQILAFYVLFPEEITQWYLLGGYEDQHRNIIEEKCNKIFGKNVPDSDDEMLEKLGKYFTTMDKSKLTSEQIQRRGKMLRKLGIKNADFNADVKKKEQDER